MSKIFSTARATLIALVVAGPALAQTPRDVASLVWTNSTPVVSSKAPSVTSGFAGAGAASDLANLVQSHNATSSNIAAGDVFATAFGPGDVARLTGVTAPVSNQNQVTVADATHN